MTVVEITIKDRIIAIRDELCSKRKKEQDGKIDLSYIEGCLDISTEIIKDIDKHGS